MSCQRAHAMANYASFVNLVQEAIRPEVCLICGKNHSTNNCDYIKISKHVPDRPVPPRAKLSLPEFLEVQILGDGSFQTVTKAPIARGSQFGPFHAEKTVVLEPSVSFPLKIFAFGDKENTECYLNSNNQETCSWLMYVGAAEYVEEQNLICYQDKGEIYYVAITDINVGDVLKVWYSPYYACKMNKSVLSSKNVGKDNSKGVDVNSLIQKQQKIVERKVWTCKFCSHIEHSVVSFARHILKHYRAQQKNICEVCKKTFASKKHLKNHVKVVHKPILMASPPKPAKPTDSSAQSKDVALGGPLLNDMFTDSSDLQQSVLNQFDLNIDNQNLLLDNMVDNILNENVKDLDHFNFDIDDGQKQFICDICLKQFTKVKLLVVHLRHHTGEFMCHGCLKIFCRKENLMFHTCNLKTRHRCSYCEKTFTQKKYLHRHIQGAHKGKYLCVSCGINYYSNKELLEHNCSKVTDADKEKFSCPICDKFFYRQLYLKRHLKGHKPRENTTGTMENTGTNMQCEICGAILESKNSYYLHKKRHQDPNYTCEVCAKRFHRKDSLTTHLVTHQKSTPYECDTCKKKFKTPRLLAKHRKMVHETSRLVRCTICDITFKTRSTLNMHIKRVHASGAKRPTTSGEKRPTPKYYNCPLCNKSMKHKSSLHRHLRKGNCDVGLDAPSIKPNAVVSSEEGKAGVNNDNSLDDQINSLLTSAENNLTIQKDAVDSLVEELDIDGKKEKEKEAREVCLSIPDLAESYQDITLDKNAYILDNGTIVQPQGDSNNVIIYVLDQAYE